MRYLRKWQLALVCLLALALLPLAPAQRGTAQAPGYTVTDLGTLGGDSSRAFGLDESGRVVGEAQAAAGESAAFRPFLWDNGTMTDLGTLGGPSGTAHAINESGTVVGSSLVTSSPHPFVRLAGGPMFDLGTLPGGFTAEAHDINVSGQVVGVSEEGSTLQDRAFFWHDANANGASDAGELQPLSATWGTPIRALGINDAGQVAGNANVNGVVDTHAFVTIAGSVVDLGTLGGSVSFANEVNDAGEVVGQSYIFSSTITQSFHAFFWKNLDGDLVSDPGEMIDLGTLGGRHSYAYDVNNSGQVVGTSEFQPNSGATRAFIWSSATGVMQDLNAVVPGTGWTFEEARAINDTGQIVGFGRNPGGVLRAFLLTPNAPTPTPTPTPVPGTLQFEAATYAVIEENTSVVISVTRTGDISGAASVDYATSDGTATAGSDYTAASGTLNFGPGETTKTFPVTVNEDTLDESDETVNLTLSTPGGGATLGTPNTATLSINDDDGQPTLQFSSPTYAVSEGGTAATVTVTRTGGSNGGVTVNYATSNGTATAGSEYTAASGTLTFAPGDNSETFTVAVANDALDESDKTVDLTLSSPGGGAALGSQATAVLTITDDDATPTLSITKSVTVIEGDNPFPSAGGATFAVKLTGASSRTVTVQYSTVDTAGTATADVDYARTSGTVTFAPGETGEKNVNVQVIGDTVDEPNETFTVTLLGPTNATYAVTPDDTFGVGTITDDDGPPSLSIGDATVTEGNSGTNAATFTVQLLPASGQAVSVNYSTSNGTATAGSDYTAVNSGTLNFAAGETSKTFTVNVAGDTAPEAHETFFVNLSNPSNATVGDSQGQGTINNDDTSISISDRSLTEGHSGNTAFAFNVTLSHATVNTVSVGYATADGTATSGGDYTAVNSGTLTFNPGDTSETATVQVVGDNTYENDETFFVNLSGASGAAISDAQGQGTITNDEAASHFQISGGPNFFVGEGGDEGKVTFTISRTGSAPGGATVNYSTGNGTATPGVDYTAASGTFTFAEGEAIKTFDVLITNDTLDEPDETVIVSLTGGFGASPSTGSSVTLNINDDDAAPTFQFSIPPGGYTTDEDGVNNSGRIIITVTRTGGTNAASVAYSTSNGTATAGLDYGAIPDPQAPPPILNFAEGEPSKTFEVIIIGDGLDEPDETFGLNLGTGGGAVLGTPSTAVVTITDNDNPPTISIGDVTVSEGSAGTHWATFTVSLSYYSGKTVTVDYATSDGTAVGGSDYTALDPRTLTFSAAGPGFSGDISKTITVPYAGDTLYEADETFNVILSNSTNATINDGTAVGTITNDDVAPTVSISDATVSEGAANAAFNVTLSAASGLPVTVNFATSDGSAAAGSDYAAVTNDTVTFAPGETVKNAAVSINGDATDEPDETFNVTLSSPTNATVSDGAAIGTITDDDVPAPVTIVPPQGPVVEGSAGTTDFTFTVALLNQSGKTVTVDYATADGTATAGSDYQSESGTVTFAPGETAKEVTVAIAGDGLDEPNETFTLNLSSPTNASVGPHTTVVVTIADDDDAPSLSINDAPTVPELDIGGGAATFTVTLSAASGRTVTVKYATADGTASGTDYTPTSGTLTFAPGDTSETIIVGTTSDNFDEPDEETFFVNLSDATGATIADAQGVGKIADNDETPKLSINDITITEGDAGTTNATFTVSLGPATGRTVTVNYATANNTAAAGSDYAATSGTLTFTSEGTKTVTVQVTGDTVNEANESFYVILSNPSNASILDTHGECFITNDDTPALRFSQATYPVGESAHFVTVTVARTGDTTQAVGVNFATSDGTATERRDYTAVSGTLRFAAGETSKTFDVLLTEDSYQEPQETINLTLSNPTGGAGLGGQATATVNIAADDTTQPQPNPIDDTTNFVRQHYHDFLNREPDASGLAFWVNDIEQCGADAGCREVKRINVSAAFFLSIEFQQTGYLVYRTYKAAYGDATSPNVEGTVPVIRLAEFLPDTRRIGEGIVVGATDWEQKLDANKNAYMTEFVGRQRFLTAFPNSMTPAEFVDRLNQNAGGVLDATERQNLVNELTANNTAAGRAGVLRKVAEDAGLSQQEFTRAFVLMQFYGYLRRNPDDPQDVDFRGWKFWLTKLNESNGNFVQAEMVKAFLDSIEYRTRFAP